jgi:hypothetical protein
MKTCIFCNQLEPHKLRPGFLCGYDCHFIEKPETHPACDQFVAGKFENNLTPLDYTGNEIDEEGE